MELSSLVWLCFSATSVSIGAESTEESHRLAPPTALLAARGDHTFALFGSSDASSQMLQEAARDMASWPREKAPLELCVEGRAVFFDPSQPHSVTDTVTFIAVENALVRIAPQHTIVSVGNH